MEYISLRQGETYIKLGQAIKKAGLVFEGSEATYKITEGHVLVNGVVERRRGRKLYVGDSFTFQGKQVQIQP